MINLTIDGRTLTASENMTILDVCRLNNIKIPTLCHDDRVKTYGACGVCVVEAAGSPKLLRSCSTLAAEGMNILTNSEKIASTRKTALELLLSDHRGDCRPPCTLACPGRTDCQGYVGLIANGEYRAAVELIKEKLPLPASIGRVCPHPCETACRRTLVEEPINIAQLKYFAADADLNSENPYTPVIEAEKDKKVAVVGGGPGGLSCAYFLRKKGIAVTIYDAMPKMGGMLRYGIPEYRLPKKVLDSEISLIENMGVTLVNEVKIGKDITLEKLRKSNDAVVIAAGAWTSVTLGCPGENSDGVIGGIDFLREAAFGRFSCEGKRIAIVGGGNTAMDACRTAVRLGADKVYNIYRRTKAEMPAEKIEIDEAEQEGVIFRNLTNPAEIIAENGRVKAVRLQLMQLGEPDASGRRAPVPIEGGFETLDADIVIIAIGQVFDPKGFEELKLTKRGTLAAGEKNFLTNLEGVFAIGDATNKGADIAIAAIGEARFSSDIIAGYLDGKKLEYNEPYLVKQEKTAEEFGLREKLPRVKMRHRDAETAKRDFNEINFGYDEPEALREATRCLECGCGDYFECKLIEQASQENVNPEKYDGFMHSRESLTDNSHPFIRRNPDKCILCGLCVRICDDVIGSTAFGLVARGFDTEILPAMSTRLADTDCISCGQCVAVCPTGALLEVSGAKKSVPLNECVFDEVCSFCGLGCKSRLTIAGNTLLRNLPGADSGKMSILCAKGRFGATNNVLGLKRVTQPHIRKNGETVAVTYDEALSYLNEKLSGFARKNIIVSVSDKLTNEELIPIKRFTESVSDNPAVCFNMKKNGISSVMGRDETKRSLEELLNADVMLVFEKDIHKSHTVAAIRMKQAVSEGKILLAVNSAATVLSSYAAHKITTDDNLDVLKQFVKSIVRERKEAVPSPEMAEYLKDTVVSDSVKSAALAYLNAENSVIVYEESAFTYDAELLIAAIAILSGKNRVVPLLRNCNSRGLYDAGIQAAEEIGQTEIKALVTFGENIELSGLEFLVCFDAYFTETAETADLVFPLNSYGETDGTYTNTFGESGKIKKAVASACKIDSAEILVRLAGKYSPAKTGRVPSAETAPSVPKGNKLFRYTKDTNALHEGFTRFLDTQPSKSSMI